MELRRKAEVRCSRERAPPRPAPPRPAHLSTTYLSWKRSFWMRVWYSTSTSDATWRQAGGAGSRREGQTPAQSS